VFFDETVCVLVLFGDIIIFIGSLMNDENGSSSKMSILSGRMNNCAYLFIFYYL